MTTRSRRALFLGAALGFLELRWRHRPDAVGALEKWLRSWCGVGDVIVGMSAQGFDIEMRALPDAWRATFYPTGTAHCHREGHGVGDDTVASGTAGGVDSVA